MSGPTTATVETLTAEVRVLMVGNRQITLSVAKQLDFVSPANIEPFGRIKAPWLGSEELRTAVIGAETGSGSLVVSAAYTPRHRVQIKDVAQALNCQVTPFTAPSTFGERLLERTVNGRDFVIVGDLGERLTWQDRTMPDSWQTDMDEYLRSLHPDTPQRAKWDALPLIVLAGLR